jgi:micrococcal nuclease
MRPRIPAALMAFLVLAFGLGALALLTGVIPQPLPEARHNERAANSGEAATVTRIIDGDTIDVTLDDTRQTQRVRILGINTPEIAHARDESDQCGGRAATDRIEDALPPGATVTLVADSRSDPTDRYGRALRYLETPDGDDVGAQLITDGYAYAWKPNSAPNPDRWDDYRDASRAAQSTRAGSWATCPHLDQSR